MLFLDNYKKFSKLLLKHLLTLQLYNKNNLIQNFSFPNMNHINICELMLTSIFIFIFSLGVLFKWLRFWCLGRTLHNKNYNNKNINNKTYFLPNFRRFLNQVTKKQTAAFQFSGVRGDLGNLQNKFPVLSQQFVVVSL